MSIHSWLIQNEIKNEKGDLIEFDDHPFLFDIYSDQSQNLTVMKAAQIGLTTLEFLKCFYDAKNYKMDMIYCVDEETEILTKRGFVFQDDLQLHDKIITLDKTGTVQWSELDEIFRKEVDMDCLEFNARNFNALVTPNHRWLLQPYRGAGEMFFRETEEMIGRYARIPKTLEHDGATHKIKRYKDWYVELLAWIFSEGYYCKQKNKNDYSVIISQSELENPQWCDEIRGIFRKAKIEWKEYNYSGIIQFRFAYRLGEKIKRIFPTKEPSIEFINELTRSQCKLFVDTFAKGDGWCDSSGTWAITQKSKQTTEALCVAAVLAGYAPSIQYPTKARDWHTIRMTQFKTVETAELKPVIKRYKGIIWCPSTKYGTFYARRKGRCYWTGNTLPTDADVKVMVGGKFNRIIAMNQCMLDDVADKDSVEQKKVGESMIYFRGTWTKKAAMMIPSDRLMHDEKDTSKLDVVADYQARLQHSKFKQTHTFSHPSLPETGVHNDWIASDQKHWHVECPKCKKWQFLNWDLENPDKMSICMERKVFQCKKCKEPLPDYVRRNGRWIAKFPGRSWSGYWVNLLMAPWVSAQELVDKFNHKDTTEEFWYTKILGLPYADAASKLLRTSFFQNLTGALWTPTADEKIVMGVDTGLRIDYVLGSKKGLFYESDAKDYDDLDALMERYPKMIAVIDSGGDLIGSRAFQERWPGRIWLCALTGDKKGKQLVTWGKGDETGSCSADRNKMIQLVVDEYRYKRIPVHGTEEDWFDFWTDWNNLSKMKIVDPTTNETKGYKWIRSGRDHRALANVFWRIGMSRFAGMGDVMEEPLELKPNSYMVNPDHSVSFDPEKMFDLMEEEEEEWRI